MTIKSIGIITGGKTAQESVNICHANDIASALKDDYQVDCYNLGLIEDIERLIADKKQGKVDIIFNNTAGKRGGDGTVEGLLEILRIPFVGSDTLATALAFDKKSTKALVAEAGVPTIKGITVSYGEYQTNPSLVVQNVSTSLGYPVVVKASQGSDSIGVSLVKSPRRLVTALNRAFKEDENIVIEEFIRRSKEITCTVIGNGLNAEALTPIERLYSSEIFNADSKDVSYKISDSDANILEGVRRYSVIAHQVVGCSDYSRSDFLLDKNGALYFLEINAHAGLGKGRSTALTAEVSKGWDYNQLIHAVLEIARKRYRKS